MNKIVVSRKIPKSFIEQLETLADVEVWNESYTPMPRDKFLASLKDATTCL